MNIAGRRAGGAKRQSTEIRKNIKSRGIRNKTYMGAKKKKGTMMKTEERQRTKE